ncbi:MAG: MlaD family protein [Alphaproteobacteria bacterium]|nr:MlaD family protein [Rhodospirillales bacterium]MCW9045457.1 MlaD family protein [Alphaproteobacteria bacterium]
MVRPNDTMETVIGALVVFGVVIAMAFSYGGKKVEGASDGYPIIAAFNKIDGLSEGADVRLAGIKIGSVASYKLDEFFRAALTMEIDHGVKLPIDTSVAIHTDGIFGSKYIVLEPGGEEDTLQPGDSIEFTQESVVVEDLLELIINQGKARLATNDKNAQ